MSWGVELIIAEKNFFFSNSQRSTEMLKTSHTQKGGSLGISTYVAGYVRKTGLAGSNSISQVTDAAVQTNESQALEVAFSSMKTTDVPSTVPKTELVTWCQ